MTPESRTPESRKPEGTSRLSDVVWGVVLLWALSIFYHFYESQGFFGLLGQIVQAGP